MTQEKLRTKRLSVDDLNLAEVPILEMSNFFVCLGKVLDGSYRRIQVDFKDGNGKAYTATFYLCGSMQKVSKKFVRIDVKKSDFDPIGHF
jgi:hypothetical protein